MTNKIIKTFKEMYPDGVILNCRAKLDSSEIYILAGIDGLKKCIKSIDGGDTFKEVQVDGITNKPYKEKEQ